MIFAKIVVSTFRKGGAKDVTILINPPLEKVVSEAKSQIRNKHRKTLYPPLRKVEPNT